MDENHQEGTTPFNLSELTAFQFGPAWARKGGETPKPQVYEEMPRRERPARRREGGERRPSDRERRDGDRAAKREGREGRPQRREGRPERAPRQLPAPAAGLRVELRPANSILEIFATQIHRQKRALPLLDLARVVMAAKDRYDLVFMKLEDGPMMIHSKLGDGACWLTEPEAVAYLWKAEWFGKFYKREEVETEAPAGSFSSVAKCSLGGELIGPANWQGYQASLMRLYRRKYASMDLSSFKARIVTDKSEEALADWLKQVSHTTVWKPLREGAEEVVLQDAAAVEADFREHHYGDVYEVVDKVFVNGATPKSRLSPGLAAHLSILSDKTARFPQMLIPNLCHGLARHHIPIYKWQGHHYTGPSRVRAIPADMVLADRMMAIVNWTKENSGGKVDAMCAALSGVPAAEDEAGKQASVDAYAPYVADMIWLMEQGFIVVTADNSIWYPKGSAAPQPTKVETPSRRSGKRAKKAQAPKADAPKATGTPTPSEPAPAEAPAAEPELAPAEAPAADEAPAAEGDAAEPSEACAPAAEAPVAPEAEAPEAPAAPADAEAPADPQA